MAKAVIMPKAGITVESCIIGKWLKNVGDEVKVGDILYTYETDKASFECESTEEGTILAIFFNDGDEVPCFTNVCAIGKPGENFDDLKPAGAASAEAPKAEEKAPEVPAAQAEAKPAAETTAKPGDEIKVSPRAKALAEKAGVNASDATATGPDGRIIERDVRKLMEEGAPVKAAAEPAKPAAPKPEAPAQQQVS